MLRHVPRHTEEFFHCVPGRYVPKYTELIARGMYRSNAFRAYNVHPLPAPLPRVRQPCYVNLRRPVIFLRAFLSSRIIIFGEHLLPRSCTYT